MRWNTLHHHTYVTGSSNRTCGLSTLGVVCWYWMAASSKILACLSLRQVRQTPVSHPVSEYTFFIMTLRQWTQRFTLFRAAIWLWAQWTCFRFLSLLAFGTTTVGTTIVGSSRWYCILSEERSRGVRSMSLIMLKEMLLFLVAFVLLLLLVELLWIFQIAFVLWP